MRPDGVTILQGGGYTFLIAYSVKLWRTSLSGANREDDLASLEPSTWYDVKPSAKAKRAVGEAAKAKTARSQPKETSQNDGEADVEKQLARNHQEWLQHFTSIARDTAGREVRLYVNQLGMLTTKTSARTWRRE